ncbi:hypothetical protein [Geobacter sp.]|uniref:hypothetical protein n=1 Tax=Geobacter sp. TaxID=46610 RepID=UPI002602CA1D|nr:hypothetical protein [Geobacter sp.]
MKCPKCGYNSFEFLDTCRKCNHDLAGFKMSHGIRPIVVPAAAAAATVAAPLTVVSPVDAPPPPADASFTWEPPAPPSPPPPKPEDDIFPDLDFGIAETAKPAPAEETFSFDLEPTAAPEPPPTAVAEPSFADFSFDEPATETAPPAFAAESSVDDGFASLLETDAPDPMLAAAVTDTSAGVELENPWDTPTDTLPGFAIEPASATPAEEEAPASFELESFEWEETEKKPEPPPAAGPKVELDAFSSDEFESIFGEPDDKKG